jgi:hypothetical protein
MKNVEMSVEGSILIIKVDLSKEFGRLLLGKQSLRLTGGLNDLSC